MFRNFTSIKNPASNRIDVYSCSQRLASHIEFMTLQHITLTCSGEATLSTDVTDRSRVVDVHVLLSCCYLITRRDIRLAATGEWTV